ncbi:CocE/NonD family hydrolase C-terminal non-catalytic domain-containing protein [Lentzea albidocapillata]|uniref:X-Pro dipeptidyl-peptidase C-terminal non-catalytic domain-containing protein n=1 Tax=Lentzea albidocapillata TaxID=40571 RepID=A0A1W2D534_9PSEU|nr:CocE/NonD family hydrolase C-terminal non-catalytic domain-containing protein [Lentzea albidocapillata]SMC92579.1 X-Pro dipeptidyl-peptidase C-terminal non-catalytic domain-containing protein [Lentzea albidocapillata]
MISRLLRRGLKLSPPLARDIGVRRDLLVPMPTASTYVFVRLCDVDPEGCSWNVCDGPVNLTSAEEARCAAVRLWPTAYRFQRGHPIPVR